MARNELPERTDVLVIGGGPGGYAAAFQAAELGLDVTLVDDEPKPGGVCLWRGCIPSKTLLYLTELLHAAEAAGPMGVKFGRPEVDIDAVRQWKEQVVDKLTGGLATLCEKRGVRLVHGYATFDGAEQVRLKGADRDSMGFKHAIIASGSRPVALPGVDFGESRRVMNSTGALALEDIPETLLVIGGGYVGLEMGMVYQAFGSRVTLVEMADRLMPNADADLVKPLARKVGKLFEGIHLNTRVSDLSDQEKHVQVKLEGEQETTETRFDRVLVAIGRRPNTEELNLDSTNVGLDDDGFIRVDAQRRTREEHIFAVGDAAGGMLLAHEAMHEGKVAAKAIAGRSAAFDARVVPAVVYTNPQLAWCGVTEQQAKDEGREVKTLRFPWRASGRALSMGAGNGLTKLVVSPETGRVLGMGIVGPEAESLIAEGVLAVEMGAVAEDLALVVHPHPTLTETIGEGAELFLGGATHYG